MGEPHVEHVVHCLMILDYWRRRQANYQPPVEYGGLEALGVSVGGNICEEELIKALSHCLTAERQSMWRFGEGGTKMVQVHAEILHQGTAHTHIHLQGYLCEDIF